MIVLDASVAVTALTEETPDGDAARTALARNAPWVAPEHMVAESAQGIRGLWLGGRLDQPAALAALDSLAELELTRVPTRDLLSRIWELRHNLSAYDAAYVAVAEALDVELLTSDRRLAAAPGIRCRVVHP